MPFTIAISETRTSFKNYYWLWLFILVFIFIWMSTFLGTTNLSNWLLENTLTFIFLIFLIASYRKFIFSDVTYLLIFIYLSLHVYGSKYTYADNPFGYYLQDVFHLKRNPYDRMVHFSFGFLLAYPMREMFLKWLKYPRLVSWILPIEITLSVSALYE